MPIKAVKSILKAWSKAFLNHAYNHTNLGLITGLPTYIDIYIYINFPHFIGYFVLKMLSARKAEQAAAVEKQRDQLEKAMLDLQDRHNKVHF